MVNHPISIPVSFYGGSNAKRKAQFEADLAAARRLEEHINAEILAQTTPTQIMLYGAIAGAVGMTTDRVRELLSRVEAGSNGITCHRLDLELPGQ